MRRTDRQLSEDLALDVLRKGEWGTLSTVDSEGQPYGVPLNYVICDAPDGLEVVFHCAPEGHKLKNIAHNARCTFSVVGKAELDAALFTTYYTCALAKGVARVEHDPAEKARLLMLLVERFSASYIEEGKKYINNIAHKAAVVRIHITSITGKALTNKK